MPKLIYLANMDDNKEHLLYFQEKIDRQMAWILLDSGISWNFINETLDSGISWNFINETFVKKNNLK